MWYGRHDFRRTCYSCRLYHYEEEGDVKINAITGEWYERKDFGTKPPCELQSRLCPKVWNTPKTPTKITPGVDDEWIADFDSFWDVAFELHQEFRIFRAIPNDPLSREVIKAMERGYEVSEISRQNQMAKNSARLIGLEVFRAINKGIKF